jgi:hypothetical protein
MLVKTIHDRQAFINLLYDYITNRNMRFQHLLLLMIALLWFGCKKEKRSANQPPPPAPAALLKDMVVSSLPAPYYHFEYDSAGKPKFVSFASEFTRYDIAYDGNRISSMNNNILVNKDRLQYFYDNEGRVFLISYADSTGEVFAQSFFTYDGQKLVKAERFHKVPGGFIIDRTMTMQYNEEDNLLELTDHRPPVDGQIESTTVDSFEQYDNKINVDGFGRLHPDFSEHLFLLPGVQLQKNNPGKETRTGDGTNYEVYYTYTYSDQNVLLTKTGQLTITNGAGAGQMLQTNSTYSYY